MIYSPSNSPGTHNPDATIKNSPGCDCQSEAVTAVGQDRQDEIADELDQAIRDLATQSALAEDRGDIEGAKELSRRMQAAIASRTPQHVQRLEQQAWQRTNRKEWEAVLRETEAHPGCFFDVAGSAIRRRMGGRLG